MAVGSVDPSLAWGIVEVGVHYAPTSTWRDWSEKLSYTTRVKAWQENLMEKWVISRVESVLDSWMSFRQVFTLNR